MGLTEPSFLERMELMGLIEPRVVTNGDRVRQMNDDELADEYIRIYHRLGWYTDSWAWLRKWLKAPADKEE